MEEQALPQALPEGFPLDAVCARIIGALIEKSMTTPDNYPLSLNSVTTACNQASNRDPVVDYSEDLVERSLRSLADDGIASLYHKPGDRVVKYVHKLDRALEIGPPALSLLAVLLLRGAQTPGELRQRTQRYATFDSLAAVEAQLSELIHHEPPLVVRLSRQPGQKEQRYQELISDNAQTQPADDVTAVEVPDDAPTGGPAVDLEEGRNTGLAERVATLEQRLEALMQLLGVDDV